MRYVRRERPLTRTAVLIFLVLWLGLSSAQAQAPAQQSRLKITIYGTVLDPNQAAIAGARVTLQENTHAETIATTTAADGRFSFEGLQAGRYVVRVMARGFKTATQEITLAGDAKKIEISIPLELGVIIDTIELVGGPLQPESRRLPTRLDSSKEQESPPRPAITINGTVRDAAGAPVADAAVSVQEGGTNAYVSATTKSDGAFSFLVLRPGTYTLRAEKKGLPPATASVMVAEGEKKHLDLVIGTPAATAAPGGIAGSKFSTVPSDKVSTSEEKPPSAGMQLSDKPSFTVAGVTDYTAVGGHGSDTKLRTSESLAKETAVLRPSGSGADATDSAKPSAVSSAAVREAESHRLTGDRAEKSGDLLASEREYEQAVKLDPSEPNYFAWGTELLLHRASRPAAEVFTKGAAAHPKSARMLAGLGAALYANGSYAEAARRVCAASDLQPADPAPYLFLGKMEKAAPDPLPCAAEKLARFAHDQPKNPHANYYLAYSIWKCAQRNESATYIKRAGELSQAAIDADPKFADPYILLGMVHAAGIDFKGAIELYKKALAADPNSTEAHYRLSQAYRRVGEEEKSKQELALYEQAEKSESEAVERQRREIRQFLIIMKDQPQSTVEQAKP